MTDVQEDYLALGSLLEDYIKERLPDSPVKILTELGDIEEVTVRGHLICVAYGGEIVPPTNHPRTATAIRQLWLTIVSIQTAEKALEAGKRMAKAGPLLAQVHKALLGKEFPGYQPLERITPPAPRLSAGFAHYTLGWAAQFTIQGDNVPRQFM
jgi:hypothetical protein